MNRPRRNQDRIIDLLREAQLRLAQGESLASVCKSLGISQSSYRRWRIGYGEQANKDAEAGVSGSTEQSAGVRLTSAENLSLAKGPKAYLGGSTPELSKEAEELLDEANGASDPARSAWLAFLFLLTYLLVTLASVSHEDLLLNRGVTLPIINVDIPLFGLFQFAPAMLLLLYLSLLVQHVILARKYRKFTDAIATYERETGTEHPARELVHSYVISQIAAGPKRNQITKLMMRLIVWVTFTILPIITLLYLQIKFLPYHDVSITYWHRIAVILGLVMLILLTPLMQHSSANKWVIKVGPQEEAWEISLRAAFLGVLLFLLIVPFSWLIATVPSEWIDRRLQRLLQFVPPASVGTGAEEEAKLLNPLMRRYVYEHITEANKEYKDWLRRWLLSYRVLIVEDTDLDADEDAKVVLRKRDFRFALLNRSDLHGSDLTWADLSGAQMWKTLAKGKLEEAELQGAYLEKAQLQGARLNAAKLQGAYLKEAQLQGAELRYANLQGADLRGAMFQGADLSYANLQGADLRGAGLQGAKLEGVKLQGADLASAGIWLAGFPYGLANQWPAPMGLAELKNNVATLARGSKAIETGPQLKYHRHHGATDRDVPPRRRPAQ
jgi:uncharacterized protein YjbI with pentapeptide repeats/transposase-like protein